MKFIFRKEGFYNHFKILFQERNVKQSYTMEIYMLFYRDTTRLRQRALFHTLLTVLLSTTLSHAMMPEEPEIPKNPLPMQPAIPFLQDQEFMNSLGNFRGVPLDCTQQIIKQHHTIAKQMFPVSKGFYTLLYGELITDPMMDISSKQMMDKALDPRNPRKPYIKHLNIASNTSFWPDSTALLPKGLLPQYPHLISLKMGKMNNWEDGDVFYSLGGFGRGYMDYPARPSFFTLKHIDISEYLITTTSLQTLSLRNHQFSNEGFNYSQDFSFGPSAKIFSALQQNTTLTCLDFSHNMIWDITLTWLTRDLRFNSGLKLITLSLSNLLVKETIESLPSFLEGFIEGIPDTLRSLPSLTRLNLEAENIGQQNTRKVHIIKENNSWLQLK